MISPPREAVLTALCGYLQQTGYPVNPLSTTYPCLRTGEETGADASTLASAGQVRTITLHLWSTTRGTAEIRAMLRAMDAAIPDEFPIMDSSGHPWTAVVWNDFETIFDDENPSLRHGVVRYRVDLYEVSSYG